MDLIISILMLGGSYFIGTRLIEKKHYLDIKRRERALLNQPLVTLENVLDESQKVKSSWMVYGGVVVSVDYFKSFWAGLKKLFGGNISAFEPVLDRGRREALLRMKESAKGADIILNTRVQTSIIGKSKKNSATGCSEFLAYGTAISLEKPLLSPELALPEPTLRQKAFTKEKKIEKEKIDIFYYLFIGIALVVFVFMLYLFLG